MFALWSKVVDNIKIDEDPVAKQIANDLLPQAARYASTHDVSSKRPVDYQRFLFHFFGPRWSRFRTAVNVSPLDHLRIADKLAVLKWVLSESNFQSGTSTLLSTCASQLMLL